MNVVLSPALPSLFALAGADGALCLEGECLLGWAWSILALTFVSARVVRRWQAGNDADAFCRFAPANASGLSGAATLPLLVGGVVPQPRTAPLRSARIEIADACLALRAPPTTDMAAAARLRAGRSFPSPRSSRSTGTPTAESPPGQTPPA